MGETSSTQAEAASNLKAVHVRLEGAIMNPVGRQTSSHGKDEDIRPQALFMKFNTSTVLFYRLTQRTEAEFL